MPKPSSPQKPSLSYRDAGVNLEVYAESMSRLPRLMHRTFTPRVLNSDGGFAGLFRLDCDRKLFSRNYKDPVLVSGTDGVGTKLKIAQMVGRHDTVGIDLVAMCVNDVICCGAEPLFFLDYIAMSHDDPERLEQVVRGISDGCVEAESALLGGETAIMPDLYQTGDYDLAGFSVGVVDRRNLIDGRSIGLGDVIIGIASSGLHSNGYSLARKIVFERAGLSVDDTFNELSGTVGEELLRPTRIYVRVLRRILNHYKVKGVVHGIAHVTGGGLAENLERILPVDVNAKINAKSWKRPPVFGWLKKMGNVSTDEMYRVFNMGIGLVLIVSPFYADNVRRIIAREGLDSWAIGEIGNGRGKVMISGRK